MDRFPLPLQVELQPDRKWRLLAPFSYLDPELGPQQAPTGFATDFASVPREPLTFALIGGYGHAAAVIHDWLYRSGQLTRRDADALFYRALRESGIARWRAWLMWGGVRLGGRSSYLARPARAF